jgi:hypothetical protein
LHRYIRVHDLEQRLKTDAHSLEAQLQDEREAHEAKAQLLEVGGWSRRMQCTHSA